MNTINLSDRTRTLAHIDWMHRFHRAGTPSEAVAAIKVLVSNARGAKDSVIAVLIEALSHYHVAISTAAVEGLVQLAPDSVEPLIAAFKRSGDQGVQAYIIQALARIGDPRAVELLAEVVGVSVANHCQGNVRRVAARGLGRIGSLAKDSKIVGQVVEKLTWALVNPEDWALRYAAAVSLEEIAIPDLITPLEQALDRESDRVVRVRIKTAIEQLQS